MNTIIIEEPPECNPVELIRLAKHAQPSLRYVDFAVVFKCDTSTVARWMCGKIKPSRAHRIWAAYLKKQWGL